MANSIASNVNILVVRFSAMGDVAMLVPIIDSFAATFPSLQITFLTDRRFVPLFAHLPNNVCVVGADIHGRHDGIKGIWTLLHEIGYRKFDLFIDLHGVWRSRFMRLIFSFVGTPTFSIKKCYVDRWLLVHGFSSLALKPVQQRYVDVFCRAGFDFNLGSLSHCFIPLADRKDIGIAPFAKHKNKIYPLFRMKNVVARLNEEMVNRGGHIYLFGGGKEEQVVLEEWASLFPNVVSLAGRKTLSEEMDIIGHLRVMLSMDSANMHMASIAGTRVVSIWGATSPRCGFYDFNQSYGDVIELDLPCRPCSIYGKRPCRYKDLRCMDIDENIIITKVLEYL